AVAARGLELVVGEAQQHAAPGVRAATDLPAADPRVRLVGRGRVRVLLVVGVERGVGFPVAAVALLYRLVPGDEALRELAEEVDGVVAVRARALEVRARFEHEGL